MQSKRPNTAKPRVSVPKRAKSQRKQNQRKRRTKQTQRRRDAQKLGENARCRPKLGNSNNENRTKKGVRAAGQPVGINNRYDMVTDTDTDMDVDIDANMKLQVQIFANV